MSDALASLRRQPYRLFFPLGALLGAAGVGYWIAFHVGLVRTYHGFGHALVQIEGFLLAFAIGFLGTMLPRRMQVSPPARGALLAAAVLLVLAALLDLTGLRAAGQVAVLLVLLWLSAFALRCLLRSKTRRPPDAFVLIPFAVLMALAGVTLVLLGELGQVGLDALRVGRAMLLEGFFVCLVLGVGRFLLPVLFGHEVPRDGGETPESRLARGLFVLAGLALLGSFVLEPLAREALGADAAVRVAYAVRAGVVLAVLAGTGAARRPNKPGTQRTLTWIAAWLVPAGFALAAVFPAWRLGMMHVTYVGGFSLLALAVGAHVVLAHGGWESLTTRHSRALRVFGAIVLFSVTVRVTADVWPKSYWTHLTAAAGLWLVGLVVWAVVVLRRLRAPRASEEESAPSGATVGS